MGLLDRVTGAVSNAYDKVSSTASATVDTVKRTASQAVETVKQTAPKAAQLGLFSADKYEGPPAEKGLAKAIAPAVAKGNAVGAQALAKEADEALKNGDTAKAKELYTKLSLPPFGPVPRDLSPDGSPVIERDGARTTVNPDKFDGTYADLAKARLGQIKFTDEMKATMGPKADPRDPTQVRDYFQKLLDKDPNADIRGKYGEYMSAFTVHPGGVTFHGSDPQKNFPETFKNQPVDQSGRICTNCQGYNFLTQTVLGGLKGKDGKPRFEVGFGGTAEHVAAGVVDKKTGKGMFVSDGQIRDLRGERGPRGEPPARPRVRAEQQIIDEANEKAAKKAD